MLSKWTLFEIGINIFEGWMYCFFLSKKMTVKSHISNLQFILATVLTITTVAMFYSLYIWFDMKLTDTVVWLFTLIYSICIFSESWYIKLAWNTCFAILMLCIVSIYTSFFMGFTGKSQAELLAPSPQRIAYVLSANVSMFIVLYIVSKLKPKQTRLSWFSLMLFAFMNVILIIGMEILFHLSLITQIPRTPITIAIFCMFFASLCALGIFELLSQKAEQQANLEIQIEVSRMSEAHNQEIKSIYGSLLEYRHDLKNQISIIETMIANGHVKESGKYLSKLKQQAMPFQYITGCISVDAMLSAKAAYMKQCGICFDFTSYPLHELPIDETDFCSIVGNLLDNAIEALLRIQTPIDHTITLSFARTHNMFYITCKNSASYVHIMKRGNMFLSSKRDGKIGLGISSIRRIVDSAEGFSSFQIINGKMVVNITLPYLERKAL